MTIKEVTQYLEKKFPLYLQEDFDNCGVQCGDVRQEITGAMVCFEMSEQVIDEAWANGCNLVISHHPLMLKRGICKIEPRDRVGGMICKALAHNMVLYSMHTNIDSGEGGGNDAFAEKLGLKNVKVLEPHKGLYRKLVVFVPADHAEMLKSALFAVGCGEQGRYDACAYTTEGQGQFRPMDGANPFIGVGHRLEHVAEERIEMIYPTGKQRAVVQALYENHPYEEPAFDLLPLENESRTIGLGRIGNLTNAMSADEFLDYLKDKLRLVHCRYAGDKTKTIRKVAVCGGGGAGFIDLAIASGADAYVSGDFKYHDFFKSHSGTLLVDIGHYEGECFIKNIIFDLLNEKFTTFATLISKMEKVEVKYF
ncbi:MAG: Nif3-like dinuclear metal center hexameric protein [Bacteroidales bacterium]|nr:Nif3-like dinuclear metal center hexameric protein [Bacteroidales bacterium]